eukprot:Filipodium_phascolosomae@DN2480_c0_g1_i1.p1
MTLKKKAHPCLKILDAVTCNLCKICRRRTRNWLRHWNTRRSTWRSFFLYKLQAIFTCLLALGNFVWIIIAVQRHCSSTNKCGVFVDHQCSPAQYWVLIGLSAVIVVQQILELGFAIILSVTNRRISDETIEDFISRQPTRVDKCFGFVIKRFPDAVKILHILQGLLLGSIVIITLVFNFCRSQAIGGSLIRVTNCRYFHFNCIAQGGNKSKFPSCSFPGYNWNFPNVTLSDPASLCGSIQVGNITTTGWTPVYAPRASSLFRSREVHMQFL